MKQYIVVQSEEEPFNGANAHGPIEADTALEAAWIAVTEPNGDAGRMPAVQPDSYVRAYRVDGELYQTKVKVGELIEKYSN